MKKPKDTSVVYYPGQAYVLDKDKKCIGTVDPKGNYKPGCKRKPKGLK